MAVARSGVAATPPSPIAARATTPSRTSRAKATATLEMSSNRRLAILWKAASGATGSGIRTARMSSPGSRTDRRYPVKYDASGTSRSPVGPGQHHRRLEREQRGRRVADGGAGAEVAAEGGTVADQPGGELRPQLVEQRHPPVEQPLGLGEGERRADLDDVRADGERAQLGQPVDGDHERGAGAAEVDLDPPVRAAGDHRGVGCSASSASASARFAGRANSARSDRTRVDTTAGAGDPQRVARSSSPGGDSRA